MSCSGIATSLTKEAAPGAAREGAPDPALPPRGWSWRSGAAVSPPAACSHRPAGGRWRRPQPPRSEEHTSELQSRLHLVCRLLLEKKKKNIIYVKILMIKKKTNVRQ